MEGIKNDYFLKHYVDLTREMGVFLVEACSSQISSEVLYHRFHQS